MKLSETSDTLIEIKRSLSGGWAFGLFPPVECFSGRGAEVAGQAHWTENAALE